MGARARLNTLYAMSALATAAIIGVLTASWNAFYFAVFVSLGLMLSDSRIRMSPPRKLRSITRRGWKRPPR